MARLCTALRGIAMSCTVYRSLAGCFTVTGGMAGYRMAWRGMVAVIHMAGVVVIIARGMTSYCWL